MLARLANSRKPAPADARDAGHLVATSGRRPLLMLTMLVKLASADAHDAGHLVATSGKATLVVARDAGRLVATPGKAILAGAHDAGQAGNLSKPGPC